MSTVLSRLNAFLDSELEQLLCFDTEIDAEKFCNEKCAIFIIIPEENPNTFFMVSLIIQQLYRDIAAQRAVAVYIYLYDRANKDGECWPSVKTIAGDIKLSPATVRRAIKDLRNAGLIETEQRYRENGANSTLIYKIN